MKSFTSRNVQLIYISALLISISQLSLPAVTTLAAGDMLILGQQSDNPDMFSWVTFVDIDAGTKIRFTDRGVTSAGTFGANSEGRCRLTPRQGESLTRSSMLRCAAGVAFGRPEHPSPIRKAD